MTVSRERLSKALRSTVKMLENHRASLTPQERTMLDQIKADLSGNPNANNPTKAYVCFRG